MVSPQQSNSVFISHFEGQKQKKSFNTIFSSVNIVSHKDIICIWWKSSNFEQFQKIIKLAMNISAYRHRTVYIDDIGLSFHDLFGLVTHLFDGTFVQFLALF